MTGPEHYREAEQMLTDGPGCQCEHSCCVHHQTLIAEAQVHATLALAAATALGREGSGGGQPSKDSTAWFDAAAECRKPVSA